MSRIVYKIFKDGAELRECIGNDLRVTLSTEPKQDGYISLDGVVKKLSEGEAVFSLASLPDGEYTPILYADNKTELEPIRKLSGKLLTLPTPDSTVRRLLLRTESLEKKTEALEDGLKKLYELIEGRIIF